MAIDAATPAQLRDLIRMVIARVTVRESGDYEIEPVPAARPFFAPQETLSLAPRTGLAGAWSKSPDTLAWYAVG